MKYKLICPGCRTENTRQEKSIIKKGFYPTRNGKTPRYFCKACSTYFSNRSKRLKNQKRPELNKRIFELYNSGLTINRMAHLLKCSKNTIKEKTKWLGGLIEAYHERIILSGALISSTVLFDEMETFEHTKLKPLSLPLAVNKEGKVIDIRVASMKAKGHIAKKSREKYGNRPDDRKAVCMEVFQNISRCIENDFRLITDKKTAYITYFDDTFSGKGELVQLVSRKTQKGEYDQMFTLNHTCAMMRAYISRLHRRTWTTTKDPQMLQAHLNLFLAYTNGYEVEDIIDQNIRGYIKNTNPDPPKLTLIQGGKKSA